MSRKVCVTKVNYHLTPVGSASPFYKALGYQMSRPFDLNDKGMENIDIMDLITKSTSSLLCLRFKKLLQGGVIYYIYL